MKLPCTVDEKKKQKSLEDLYKLHAPKQQEEGK